MINPYQSPLIPAEPIKRPRFPWFWFAAVIVVAAADVGLFTTLFIAFDKGDWILFGLALFALVIGMLLLRVLDNVAFQLSLEYHCAKKEQA